MFLRNWFKNSQIFGKSPSRLVRSDNEWMKAQRAKIAAAKAAAEQLETQKRMASSLNEPYDLSFKMAKSEPYDYSQRIPQSYKDSYDFSQ